MHLDRETHINPHELISTLAKSWAHEGLRGAGQEVPMEKVRVDPDTVGWEATRQAEFQAVKQPQ